MFPPLRLMLLYRRASQLTYACVVEKLLTSNRSAASKDAVRGRWLQAIVTRIKVARSV
jgi:hypothetical protein